MLSDAGSDSLQRSAVTAAAFLLAVTAATAAATGLCFDSAPMGRLPARLIPNVSDRAGGAQVSTAVAMVDAALRVANHRRGRLVLVIHAVGAFAGATAAFAA